MGIKAKSARGVMVDFDMIKIKEQMASTPPSTNVKARQDFIDKRLRRRLKKVQAETAKVEDNTTVDMPTTEDLNVETKMIDGSNEEKNDDQSNEAIEALTNVDEPAPTTRQRAKKPTRKSKTTTDEDNQNEN